MWIVDGESIQSTRKQYKKMCIRRQALCFLLLFWLPAFLPSSVVSAWTIGRAKGDAPLSLAGFNRSRESKWYKDAKVRMQQRRDTLRRVETANPFSARDHEDPSCSSIYIDLDASFSVEVHKLFRPGVFPKSKIHTYFEKWFGSISSRKDHVCAFVFNPNPSHRRELLELERMYRSQGYKVTIHNKQRMYSKENLLHVHRGNTQPKRAQPAPHLDGGDQSGGNVLADSVKTDLAALLQMLQRRHKNVGNYSTKLKVVMRTRPGQFELDVLQYLVQTNAMCVAEFLVINLYKEIGRVQITGTKNKDTHSFFAEIARQCPNLTVVNVLEENASKTRNIILTRQIHATSSAYVEQETHLHLPSIKLTKVTVPHRKIDSQCKIWLFTVIAVRFDDTFPWFLDHYLERGIKRQCFLIVFNVIGNANDQKLVQYLNLALSVGVVHMFIWYGQYSSYLMFLPRFYVLKHFTKKEHWVVHVDSDEFHSYENADEVVQHLQGQYDCVQSYFVDRLSNTGELTLPIFGSSLQQQYPLQCSITADVQKSDVSKVAIFRSNIRTDSGNHHVWTWQQIEKFFSKHKTMLGNLSTDEVHALFFPAEEIASPVCFSVQQNPKHNLAFVVDHFKWTMGVAERLHDRVQFLAQDPTKQYSHGAFSFFTPVLSILEKNKASLRDYCFD